MRIVQTVPVVSTARTVKSVVHVRGMGTVMEMRQLQVQVPVSATQVSPVTSASTNAQTSVMVTGLVCILTSHREHPAPVTLGMVIPIVVIALKDMWETLVSCVREHHHPRIWDVIIREHVL
jgi:hypothetical protein